MTDTPNTDAPDATPNAPAAPPERTPEEVEQDIMSALVKDREANTDMTPEQTFGGSLLGTALSLRAAGREHTKQTTVNRDMLRNLAASGALTETQNSAVALIYPTRERKPKPAANAPQTPVTPPVNPAGSGRVAPATGTPKTAPTRAAA